MSNQEIAKGLRELADFIEKSDIDISPPVLNVMRYTKEAFHAEVKKLGAFEKADSGSFLSAIKKFSGDVKIDVSAYKDLTCKKIIKGYETVPARPAAVIPAVPEHQEPVYGWECPESFLKDEKENAPLPA